MFGAAVIVALVASSRRSSSQWRILGMLDVFRPKSWTRKNKIEEFPAAELTGLMSVLDDLMGSKAPFQIPTRLKTLAVRFGPLLVLGLMILTLPGQLMSLGMRVAVLPFSLIRGDADTFQLTLDLSGNIGLMILMVMALPGLQERRAPGWYYLAFATALNSAAGLASGALVGPVIGGLLSLYVLVQLRRFYR